MVLRDILVLMASILPVSCRPYSTPSVVRRVGTRHSIFSPDNKRRLLGQSDIAAIIFLQLAFGTPASAQYMYLDANGDALSSEADVLNATGIPTMVSVYLNTSRNPDSSVAYCTT